MLELRISGMTCGHCVRAVTRAARAVPGAAGVTVDLARGLAWVSGEPDPAAVRAAIAAEGYEVDAAVPA
jgi:copper chaperone